MSEPVTANNLKNLFLQCPVCQEHFNHAERTPRILTSCLHAFCTQCLEALLTERIHKIRCPLCRHVQKVRGGAESLPKDPVRYQLTEYLDTQKNQQHYCPNHPDRLIECFCENCENLCCLMCAFIEHKGHDTKTLQEMSQTIIRNIKDRMNEVTEKLTATNNECTSFTQSTKTARDKTISDIKKEFKGQLKLLKRRRDVLIGQVEKETDKLLDAASELGQYNLAVMESAKTYVMNATTGIDDIGVIRSYPAVMETLVDMANQNDNERKGSTSRVQFHDINAAQVRKIINIYGFVEVTEDNGSPKMTSSDSSDILFGLGRIPRQPRPEQNPSTSTSDSSLPLPSPLPQRSPPPPQRSPSPSLSAPPPPPQPPILSLSPSPSPQPPLSPSSQLWWRWSPPTPPPPSLPPLQRSPSSSLQRPPWGLQSRPSRPSRPSNAKRMKFIEIRSDSDSDSEN